MVPVKLELLTTEELRNLSEQEKIEGFEDLDREELIQELSDKYEDEASSDSFEEDKSSSLNLKNVSSFTDYRDNSAKVTQLPGVEDLPEKYEETSIHLLYKNSDWGYAFWSVSTLDQNEIAEKNESYFKFFNCHPWFGQLILMADLAIESTRDANATETALDVRTSLMGPLAGLGDAIVWVLLPTVLGAIAGYQAQQGSLVGMFIAMAGNIALWTVFWKLSIPVYHKGVSFITSKSESLRNLTDVCSILGIIVMGAMVATTVNVKFGLTWTVGDLTQNLNDLLNTIIPIVPKKESFNPISFIANGF